MATSIAIRLAVEGKTEVKQALEETGRSGQDAFRQVGTAADQASAATDKLTRKAQEAAAVARQAQGAAAGAAAAPVPSSSPVSAPAGTPNPATAREVERVRARLDEEYRNTRQLERDVAAIGRGEAAGSFSTAYATRLRDLAERRYGTGNDNDPAAPRRGLSDYQRKDLMYQSGDVVASLGSGAGLGTVAFQQGPQILQGLAGGEGGLKGGLKALGESALSLVTPMSVGAAAVAGLGAAFLLAGKQAGDGRETLEKATHGIGRTTGATAAQLDVLARANAEAGKVSVSTAQEIVAGYASTGKIALPVIGDLTRATSEYARVTGQDVPTATAELARMFADPARGADDLAAKIGGLDDRTRQLIQTQIEQGDRTAAQQTLADSLKASIDANATATTGWAAAWNTAATAAAGYWEQAKKIAGLKLGIVPEGAQEALTRTERDLANLNNLRAFTGQGPAELGSKARRERDAALVYAEQERMRLEGEAAEERAGIASRTAGAIARAVDPNFARLSTLRQQQSDLRDALGDPLARSKIADFAQTETAYLGVTRAIESLTDANGKLISSEERARRQDQLRLEATNAKTAAEKAAVAERQKAFDLVGQTITGSDARGQIERAGILARAEADSKKGGGEKEKRDDYDRALRSAEDRTRRIEEQATTFGMGAEAIERYRVQQELLTAAQRAGRDVTPELTRQIEEYASKAGDAAKRNEEVRDRLRSVDDFRNVGSDGVRSLVRDLGEAKSGADILGNALERVKQRVLDIASDSLTDALFGKRGTRGCLLASFLGAGGGSATADAAAGPVSGVGGFVTSLKSLFGYADGGVVGLSMPPGGVCGQAQGCGELPA